ncbi:sorbitol dehydrogenase protein [Lasallia pustulata]|uniref:Sorbitol dehydrogenase protein n=1 Tax=Lasallia pustulata TaxID=136370 RepID=A0A1W5CWV2_9LECA|nr:sorbitol dehydrogenase protein [Lasallia pustulata]
MQALRFHGQKDIRLEEIDIPTCGKGQVKIKPAYVGICGTGHEFSGVVEEVGEEIDDVKVGDRVVVQPIIYDGTCGACKAGFINCCDKNGFVGLSGWGGGLAEHIVLPRSAVISLPDSISLEVGALVEPLAVAWHAVNMSPYQKGDSVLVLGGGPIGLAVIQSLKVKGCEKIIVSEVAPRRKEFAKQFGAHYVLDPTKDDIVSTVREICDGQGANVAFDAAGVQAGLDQAILAIRARGTLVNIAVWEKAASIQPNSLVFRERRYMGVATYVQGDFQDVMDAIASGKLRPEAMITRKISMNEVEEKGFKTLVHDKDNHVKILVEVCP